MHEGKGRCEKRKPIRLLTGSSILPVGYSRVYGEKYFSFRRYEMKRLISRFICKIFNHVWIDDSTAGPETGNMSVYCKRCGESHCTILY